MLCLCMSSNCSPCLLACVMVFITSHRSTGACVVGGVLVLLLSSMSRFFLNLPLILFSAPVGGDAHMSTQQNRLLWGHAHFRSRVWRHKSKHDWPHTVTYRHTYTTATFAAWQTKTPQTVLNKDIWVEIWWCQNSKSPFHCHTTLIIIKATIAAGFVIKASFVIAHQNTQAIKCRIKGRRIKGRTEAEQTGHFSYSHFLSEPNIFLLFYQHLQHTTGYYCFRKVARSHLFIETGFTGSLWCVEHSFYFAFSMCLLWCL